MNAPAARASRRRPAIAAIALALAALPLACGGLDPGVYREGAQPTASSALPASRLAAPRPASDTLRTAPRGRWSDDGLRYEERETATGVPFLPFPLSRTRLGEPDPLPFGIGRDGRNLHKTTGTGK